MAKIGCLAKNHNVITHIDGEYCKTCLENEITRLRAYVQRGSDLLSTCKSNQVIDEYREKAESVLKESLFI